MGVATLTDLIGSLLSPDNVTVLAAMTMTEIASTICEALNMSHVIFLVCQVCFQIIFCTVQRVGSNLCKICKALMSSQIMTTVQYSAIVAHVHTRSTRIISLLCFTGGRDLCFIISLEQ